MTTPNQPPPLWMAALGLGAFELGGTGGGTGTEGSYGQNITESLVNGLVYGPLSVDNVTASSGAVEDVVTVMTNLMTTLPISALKYLQPFIPGATDADFADSTSAVNFIAAQFIPKTTVNTFTWLGRFLQDLEILFDVFHITYPVGAPTDVAGQTSWYAAWNDLLELIGLTSGTTPTTAAPTIGTAITAAGTAGANGSSWSTRLTNDLLILLDVFHLTYTSTQWNSAWTDLLSLFGIVNSVTAPTNPTPTIGPAITSAQSSATTANTNASTAQSTANTNATRTARKAQNDLIIGDWFHTTYPIGSISDTAATLVGGKRTWWGAWNDNLTLLGILLGITAPTDPASDVGTSIAANTAAATTAGTNASIAIATNQNIIDNIYTASNGGATTGNPVSSVLASLTAIPASNIVGSTGAAVTFGASGAAGQVRPATQNGSVSWTHTIATGDLGVLAIIAWSGVASGYTTSVTYGGTAMTLQQSQRSAANVGGGYCYLEFWWLKSPATGTKTVSATVTGTSGTVQFLGGSSESYVGSKVGAINFAIGSSATPAVSVSSSVGPMVVAAMLTNTGGTLSAFNKTQRYNFSNAAPNAGTFTMLIGDAAGASSVAFSASTPSSGPWVAIAVELTN